MKTEIQPYSKAAYVYIASSYRPQWRINPMIIKET